MKDEEARLARNRDSRLTASQDGTTWLRWEVELLLLWQGGEAELAEVAELLGRTIEACRQRFYDTRSGRTPIPLDQDEASRRAREDAGDRSPRQHLPTVSQRETWSEEDREEYGSGWYV